MPLHQELDPPAETAPPCDTLATARPSLTSPFPPLERSSTASCDHIRVESCTPLPAVAFDHSVRYADAWSAMQLVKSSSQGLTQLLLGRIPELQPLPVPQFLVENGFGQQSPDRVNTHALDHVSSHSAQIRGNIQPIYQAAYALCLHNCFGSLDGGPQPRVKLVWDVVKRVVSMRVRLQDLEADSDIEYTAAAWSIEADSQEYHPPTALCVGATLASRLASDRGD